MKTFFSLLMLCATAVVFAQTPPPVRIFNLTVESSASTVKYVVENPFIIDPICTANFTGEKTGPVVVQSAGRTVVNLSGSFVAGDKVQISCALNTNRNPCRNCPPPNQGLKANP